MSIKETIRQEIERRKGKSYYLAMMEIMNIIDSLPVQEPSKDLEEEIVRFLNSEESTTYIDDGMLMSSYKDPHKIARHFAKWGAEHLKK